MLYRGSGLDFVIDILILFAGAFQTCIDPSHVHQTCLTSTRSTVVNLCARASSRARIDEVICHERVKVHVCRMSLYA